MREAWEITKVPKADIYEAHKLSELLAQVATLSAGKDAVLEVGFFSSPTAAVRTVVSVASVDLPLLNVVSSAVEATLNSLNFQFYTLDEKDIAALDQIKRSCYAADTSVLVKSEQAISSSLSYLGYYYYADTMSASEGGFVPDLFQILSNATKSSVCIQIIPTNYFPNETIAIHDLVATLPQAICGIGRYGQAYAEPFAQAPLEYYTYYSERQNRHAFLYNVIAASEEGLSQYLLSTLQAKLRSLSGNSLASSIVSLSPQIIQQLTSSMEFFPYRLNEYLQANCRNYNIWGSNAQPTNLARMPYILSEEESSALFQLPCDDGKTPGVARSAVANTSELVGEKATVHNGIVFGKVKDNSAITISPDAKGFTQHALVVGMPGTGKTTFAVNLLMQFYRKGIPFLVIEPTKTEFRAMATKIPELQIFTLGKSDIVPFRLNPFIPPKGITLEQYIPSLMSAFKVTFSMPSPLDTIFLSAIRKCYTKYGWKSNSLATDSDVEHFGMYEFIREFKSLVATSEYSKDVRSNLETGGTFRLMNLLEQNSSIYDSQFTMPIDVLLQKPTVVELNAIADEEQRSMIMALLLINLCLFIKDSGSSNGELRNIILIDEAHVLLDAHSAKGSEKSSAEEAVKTIENMIAEVRSYGTGIIIADQSPARVGEGIVANTDIKVSFRLVEKKHRDIIANSTDMPVDHAAYLSRLQRGEAFVSFTGLEPPRLIVTPNRRAEEGIGLDLSDTEVQERSTFWKEYQQELKPFYECRSCSLCTTSCNGKIRVLADYYASKLSEAFLQGIKDANDLLKYTLKLHDMVIKYEQERPSGLAIKQLCNCTKIQFVRKVLLSKTFQVNRQQIVTLLKHTLFEEVS